MGPKYTTKPKHNRLYALLLVGGAIHALWHPHHPALVFSLACDISSFALVGASIYSWFQRHFYRAFVCVAASLLIDLTENVVTAFQPVVLPASTDIVFDLILLALFIASQILLAILLAARLVPPLSLKPVIARQLGKQQ